MWFYSFITSCCNQHLLLECHKKCFPDQNVFQVLPNTNSMIIKISIEYIIQKILAECFYFLVYYLVIWTRCGYKKIICRHFSAFISFKPRTILSRLNMNAVFEKFLEILLVDVTYKLIDFELALYILADETKSHKTYSECFQNV